MYLSDEQFRETCPLSNVFSSCLVVGDWVSACTDLNGGISSHYIDNSMYYCCSCQRVYHIPYIIYKYLLTNANERTNVHESSTPTY